MAGFKFKGNISGKELKSRIGYILLGFFSFYLVDPIQTWVDANLSINPLVVGIVGILATLYFFDF